MSIKKPPMLGIRKVRSTQYWDRYVLGSTLIGGGLVIGLMITEDFNISKDIKFMISAIIGLAIAIPLFYIYDKYLISKK